MNASNSCSLVVLNYNDSARTIALCKLADGFGFFSSIVIVNNKGSEQAERLLKEFSKQTSGAKYHFIFSERNLGYCGGCNLGLRFALDNCAPSSIVLANSDVTFESSAITASLSFLETQESAGAVSPLMMNPDGSVDYNWGLFPSFQDGLNSIFYFGERRFRKKQFKNAESWLTKPFFLVPWIRSSLLIFKKQALQKSGLFDERFFLYCGEYSLFTRLAENHYSSFILPDVQYVHHHISSNSFRSLHKRKTGSVKSMLLYLEQYQKINVFQKILFWLLSWLAVFEYDCLYARIALKRSIKQKRDSKAKRQ